MARLLIVVDASAPLESLEQELTAFASWPGARGLSVERIVMGATSGWLPEGISLAKSAVTASVRRAAQPALDAALKLANARPPDALLVVLAGEPASGWQNELRTLTSFKAVVSFGVQPEAASGQGLLGAPFIGAHFALALRWLARELADRSWTCACGAGRLLGATGACARCGSLEAPRVVEVGGRQVVLETRALLFPHHLGRALSFERKPLIIEATVADGPLELEGGVHAVVRRATTASPRETIEAPLRAEIDRCASCEAQLVGGNAAKHDPPDPRRFCLACVDGGLRCDFCMVPVTSTVSRWPDGRKACKPCWSTAINDLRVLESLAERARTWMTRTLGMDPGPCPIRFEHAAGIAQLHGFTFEVATGYTARPVGFYAPPAAGGPFLVIEHGTPRGLAYGVLVHELTHAWQALHWPRLAPRTLVEGLAMWVEYQALLAEGAIHAARSAERFGDPVYGVGFRVALSVEAKHGAEFVKHRLHEVREWAL